MATHDYVIDNQSAPSLRSDLNNVLQAIVTQNSSATAPATTYADMIWYDTANNQLKKRNETNSGWITLGTIDEGLGTFTPSGTPAIASQAEAQAGTDNTKLMTPLRVAQSARPQTATAVASTSGTSIDFTGIPSWVKRITVMFSAVSTSGTSPVQIQLGDSGGLETTGYNSGAFSYDSATPSSSTTGLVVDEDVGGAAASRYGAYVLTLLDGNVWVGRGNLIVPNITLSAGGKTLSATLDRIRITTVNGTDTFDAGSINVMWE